MLDERFADSPILVTIPLFTFVGYLMAESKTPDRIVRASRAFFGWMPGGLAHGRASPRAPSSPRSPAAAASPSSPSAACSTRRCASRSTPTTSRSAWSPPAARSACSSRRRCPILVYALVAGIDFNKAFKAALLPGLLIMALLDAYAAYVGTRPRCPRDPPQPLGEMAAALWLIKWELLIPVIILGGLGDGPHRRSTRARRSRPSTRWSSRSSSTRTCRSRRTCRASPRRR